MKRLVLRDVMSVALVGLLSLWLAPLASPQQPAPQPGAAPQAKISDRDLRAFAKAYVEYHKIRERYESSLSTAKEPAEKERIQREGNAKVKEVIEKEGLSVEGYNMIFTTINANEEMRNKALKLVDEERKKS